MVRVADYQESQTLELESGAKTAINLPKSNVLQFFTADGSKITARPSGTEPKIKFYFGLKAVAQKADELPALRQNLQAKTQSILNDLGV